MAETGPFTPSMERAQAVTPAEMIPGVYQGANLVDVMSVEGIDEVNSVKGVIPAEYANVIGGQVNLISRSGTNSWHGSLFENNQNSALNARFQRAATKPHLTLNQFGGSLGGPIEKQDLHLRRLRRLP